MEADAMGSLKRSKQVLYYRMPCRDKSREQTSDFGMQAPFECKQQTPGILDQVLKEVRDC